jgi:PAS domain S-box-containing protein
VEPVVEQDRQEQIRDVILDSVADGVFTVDSEWRVTSFNRAAEQITGVRREEAIGKRCCDVFRASVCESQCVLKRTMDSGRPIINQAIYIVDSQGRRIPISISTAILKDGKGQIIGGVETFRDLSQVEELRKQLNASYTFADIVGRSAPMRKLFEVLPTIAESDSTVMIEGASGTGKELFARAIHSLSPRRRRRFVALNCGAMPDTLLESELFGYKAGAFTDARRDKPGRFALAEGGTIFLDEIGDISQAMQTRLLRVLQERIYEPLGSVEPVPSNVRVIAATHRNLENLVREGTFRQDLFYRINVIRLKLPELRERLEDLPLMVEHFVSKFNRLRHKDILGLSEKAMAVLMHHDFPGNVRELENVIEHAFVLCPGGLIEPQHLPPALVGSVAPDHMAGNAKGTLEGLEGAFLADLIHRHHGNRAAAARDLGVHPSTLFRKVKALGIELPKQDGRHRQPMESN